VIDRPVDHPDEAAGEYGLSTAQLTNQKINYGSAQQEVDQLARSVEPAHSQRSTSRSIVRQF